MIAAERPAVAAERPAVAAERPAVAAASGRTRSLPWSSRLSAALLAATILVSLGGGGLVDVGNAYSLQGRAEALQQRWEHMVGNGIPVYDLAELRAEWAQAQASKLLGTAGAFWLPGGADTLTRWEAATDAVWARDLSRYRSDALGAEQLLHDALAPETHVQRKARLDVLAQATTPLEFATLRDEWMVEARLVPIDKRIAGAVAGITGQTAQARSLGIRSDPAADVIARASAYTELVPADRMARAEMLTRTLVATTQTLQVRIGAATVTQQWLQRAANEIALAQLYGLDTTALSAQVASDQAVYANTLSPAEFASLTAHLQQVTASADHQIYVALSQTHVIGGVAMIYQNHPLSCEEASTSMALTHQGIYVSQDQILAEIGSDRRPMYVDSAGRVRWGNPYLTFVGNVNGSESNYTGFGTYWPPLVRVARAHGARLIAYGSMSAATIYARVIAGHPVVAFATWDWAWHPRRDYLSFDGQWIPWIGPVYASHVYVVVGVGPGQVLVNDPIRGQYWVSKAAFEAAYSDFGEAIVFL